MDDTTPPHEPDAREKFIETQMAARRAERQRLQAMTTKELLADLQQGQEAQWRLVAASAWDTQQMRQAMQPLHTPPARPAFPPGATVPPDVGSRLEALEDSVSLLHAKLDTIMAQLAAWERDQGDPPHVP